MDVWPMRYFKKGRPYLNASNLFGLVVVWLLATPVAAGIFGVETLADLSVASTGPDASLNDLAITRTMTTSTDFANATGEAGRTPFDDFELNVGLEANAVGEGGASGYAHAATSITIVNRSGNPASIGFVLNYSLDVFVDLIGGHGSASAEALFNLAVSGNVISGHASIVDSVRSEAPPENQESAGGTDVFFTLNLASTQSAAIEMSLTAIGTSRTVAIPTPSAVTLLLMGIAGLALQRRQGAGSES